MNISCGGTTVGNGVVDTTQKIEENMDPGRLLKHYPPIGSADDLGILIAVLRRYAQQNPLDPRPHSRLGDLLSWPEYANAEWLSIAMEEYEKAIEMGSQEGETYTHAVEAALRVGDSEKARRIIEQAGKLEKIKKMSTYYLSMGIAHENLGEHDVAAACYLEGIKRFEEEVRRRGLDVKGIDTVVGDGKDKRQDSESVEHIRRHYYERALRKSAGGGTKASCE
jgi:tetratricopeptide (TPR) repeat protein